MSEYHTATEIKMRMEAFNTYIEERIELWRAKFLAPVLHHILKMALRREVITVLQRRLEQIATGGSPEVDNNKPSN